MGEIRFTQSTRRHRIGRARALHVMAHHVITFTEDAPEGSRFTTDRNVYLGDDPRGFQLEVMSIFLADHVELVIHVQAMSNRYREIYEMGKAAQ